MVNLRNDMDQVCLAAERWIAGEGQLPIAISLGFANSTQVCDAFREFVKEWMPESITQFGGLRDYGNERKRLLKTAIRRYRIHKQLTSQEGSV